MAEVKHTPDWRWERSGCRVYAEQFHRGRPVKVADVSVALLDEDELNFRGRLIAAAPDLFEALTEARLALSLTRTNIMVEMKKSEGSAYRWEGVPDLLEKRIAQCDAALSKATTQQEGR